MLTRDLCLAHSQIGHDVAIAALNPVEPSFEAEVAKLKSAGVTWFSPTAKLGRRQRLAHIRKAITAFEPSIVVAHSVLPSFYARIALLLRNSPKVVSVLHDASRNDYASERFRLLERLLTNRAAAIVAVAPEALSNYARRVGTPKRMVHISNGVDVLAISSAVAHRDRVRREFYETGEGIIWLQVGRFARVKQQHLSIEALARTVERAPAHIDIILLLAGIEEDLAYVAELRRLAVRLGVAEKVKFLGPRVDIPELLAAADVYLMPSSTEAQTLALLEALASGVPILASDIEPFKFAAEFGAVKLADPSNTQSFAEAAKALSSAPRVERDLETYSIARTASAYLSLFRSLE